ncbi:MAG TPA: beta-glucosidase BglX [Candidatus Saccharimonadales bacterium]|nr:beta-glucosidase BglX [Candidatus Saccharimonadales bacterium]
MVASASQSVIYHDGWIDLDKNGKTDVYEDPTQRMDKRVTDLLKRMTLNEKIGQLWQVSMPEKLTPECTALLKRGEISSFLSNDKWIETPAMRNRLQRIAVEQSRLGIPLIFGSDVIHGFRTVFPIPLAQACAWDPGLFQQTQAIAAREAAAAGVDWAFAPMVDLARDPRWGRIAEGFGEDPWLGSLYAAAAVRGFQGPDVAGPNQVVACLKHYVGYGAAEGGRDYNTTEISEFTLRNFYLPQFKAGVDAGALTIMSSFNCLSGFPASADRHTLTDILRREWKFNGFVVSDWNAVAELMEQGVAANEAEAARLALTAGVDMEMVSTNYHDTLKQQVLSGKIPESVLNEAVRRVLTVKFEKGLFDHPYVDESRCSNAFLRPDAIALAREAAAKSCVLLKDEDNALPVSKEVKRIALIGPLADDADDLVGCWCSRAHDDDIVSLAQGIRAKLQPGAQLMVARGCRVIDSGKPRYRLDGTEIKDAPTGSNEIAEAASLAKTADVVVMALGEPRQWCGENSSRSQLTLPGKQQELFDAVATTGKPVIVVLFNGRPLALTDIEQKAAAILEAWYPGVQGGNGVADVLFGDVDPSGRLATTFPRSVGQVPLYYNHYNTGRPTLGKYIDDPTTPLYPFGFGLAYTTFKFGEVTLSEAAVPLRGRFKAEVQIQNTGTRVGTAVAELYIRALAASAGPRPVRELRGFRKVFLEPGETRDVAFTLNANELGYYDSQGNWLVEPGKFQIRISPDSASGEPASLELEK